MSAAAIPGFPAPDGLWSAAGAIGSVHVANAQPAIWFEIGRNGSPFTGKAELIGGASYGNEAPTLEAAKAEALDAGRSLAADALMATFADRADALKFLALHLERTAARDAFAATRTKKEI